MKAVSQLVFDANIAAQQQTQGEPANALEYVDLSAIAFEAKDLDGATIAMSRFHRASFSNEASLQGITWIGNKLVESRFVGLSMNKAEILDCDFECCKLEGVSLFRADLAGTRFIRCELIDLDLTTAFLGGVILENCHCRGVKLRSGPLEGCCSLQLQKT